LPVTLPEAIVRRRCSALIPYARNARTHSDQQVAQIAASIREFGFTNPVLIDEEDGIIAGHGRVLAAHLLGLDDSQPRGNGAGTALERENAVLRERLTDKDNVIEDLRRRLDAEAEERRKLTMILTDRRPRKRWWRRLFGRAGQATGSATVRSNDSQSR
jgi:hypothetical protein